MSPIPEPSPDSEIEVSSLFKGVWHREAPDLPTIQPKRRESRAPFIVAVSLLLVLVVAFFALNATSKPKTVPEMLAEGPQTAIGALYSPETVVIETNSAKSQYERF